LKEAQRETKRRGAESSQDLGRQTSRKGGGELQVVGGGETKCRIRGEVGRFCKGRQKGNQERKRAEWNLTVDRVGHYY